MIDLLGRPIRIGDRLAYGGRMGAGSFMAVMKVKKLNERTVSGDLLAHTSKNDRRTTVVMRPERAVVLE